MFITFYLLISLGKTILCLTALLMYPVRAVEHESFVLRTLFMIVILKYTSIIRLLF